jgi:hypothetical protein
VDLHQVKTVHTPEPGRQVHLADAGDLRGDPDLGCREHLRRPIELLAAVAHGSFREAVHRGGIHHAAAAVQEGPHDLDALFARVRERRDVEGEPRAHADRGDFFARYGNRFQVDRQFARGRTAAAQRRGGSHAPDALQHRAPRNALCHCGHANSGPGCVAAIPFGNLWP